MSPDPNAPPEPQTKKRGTSKGVQKNAAGAKTTPKPRAPRKAATKTQLKKQRKQARDEAKDLKEEIKKLRIEKLDFQEKFQESANCIPPISGEDGVKISEIGR